MTLRVVVHDVGHGQAIHVFCPDSQIAVIDLGCSNSFSPLRWLRDQTGTIDLLFVTHPHGDHIDEVLLLAELGFSVRQLVRPAWLSDEEIYAANGADDAGKVACYLLYSSDKKNTPIPADEYVGNPAVNGGVKIQHFFSSACGRSNINNHSAVVVIEYAGSKIVIPGDNEGPSWKALLENYDFRAAITGASVFVASHHGRLSGYYPDLFADNRKPALCIVSDAEVQDTDARDRYSYHATGWIVHSRGGTASETRYAVTTRSDGPIDILAGIRTDGQRFLSVTAN